jgi:hypothetical protein
MFLDWIIYSTIFYPAISYWDIKFSFKSSINLSNYSFIFRSVISWLPKTFKTLLLRFCFKSLEDSNAIYNYFSLNILWIVSSSLQETLGRIGKSKYSPTKASMCFLIRGVNSTDVG